MDNLISTAQQAVAAAQKYADSVTAKVNELVRRDGKIDRSELDQQQRAVHGMAWVQTTVAAMHAITGWAINLETRQSFLETDQIVLQLALNELLAQLSGGLPMAQNEICRPADFGSTNEAEKLGNTDAVRQFTMRSNTAQLRAALISTMIDGNTVSESNGDQQLDAIREIFHRYTEEKIIPFAHQWHLDNALIPTETVDEMSALGTFGVCIDEQYGGLGLGKTVMCVISEELSRGWICAGSLGTRSEIAAELISMGGTDAQKSRYLPAIASGEILPTAVFTEPNTGSDMGSLATRGKLENDSWHINGAKTWITHASRTDLMTLLARTMEDKEGYAGLSMFLVDKQRGSGADLFPDPGLKGTEIEVLGYRGMREYELSFDDFKIPKDALLGEEQGKGFKQLMQTFESARIQTAARSVGVARRAFELGFQYATDRQQFGQALIRFPRVSDKLAMMVTDTIVSRELTYFAAREKDKDHRCDIEAGMAKLLAARTAWSNADSALQIHGGNGYALEYEISRVLCDARILNIFEGAAEIQAQVIARGLLARAQS